MLGLDAWPAGQLEATKFNPPEVAWDICNGNPEGPTDARKHCCHWLRKPFWSRNQNRNTQLFWIPNPSQCSSYEGSPNRRGVIKMGTQWSSNSWLFNQNNGNHLFERNLKIGSVPTEWWTWGVEKSSFIQKPSSMAAKLMPAEQGENGKNWGPASYPCRYNILEAEICGLALSSVGTSHWVPKMPLICRPLVQSCSINAAIIGPHMAYHKSDQPGSHLQHTLWLFKIAMENHHFW